MQKSGLPKHAAHRAVDAAPIELAFSAAGSPRPPRIFPARGSGRQAAPAGAGVSLIVHAAVVAVLFSVNPAGIWCPRKPEVVELEVRELPPPAAARAGA